jgi:uncharacterized protein YgbK (DUF1537 family)
VNVAPSGDGRVAVLDDDPTGVQTLSGVRVLLDWTVDRVARAFGATRSVHLLTNARALTSQEARAIVLSAASSVLTVDPSATVILRGDSTLRGYVLEEYLAVREAKGTTAFPPLVLAPALPSAGRVTIGGVQYLEQGGSRIPVHATEFARDGPFAYASSRLLEWAEERSDGLFEAKSGIEVGLEALRRTGPNAVADAVAEAAKARAPTAVSIDAETTADVDVAAEGIRQAAVAYTDFIVRCGPALAGALGNATAAVAATLPAAEQILVVCGSYVAQSTRQLSRLSTRFPDALVAVDPFVLFAADEHAFARVTCRLQERLDRSGLAVLAIAGQRPEKLSDLSSGLRIAQGLAALIASVDRPNALVVLKGGVTSAVVLKHGLRAVEADIVGPVLPGVALWQTTSPELRSVLVVPGNVGDDDLLVRLVELARRERP